MPGNGTLPEIGTYAALRTTVRVALIETRAAMESSRVEGYRATGQAIEDHVMRFKERADYGQKTIRRLARDLETHYSVLYRCVRFVRAFPIVAARQQLQNLSWTHYRVLMQVRDGAVRAVLANRAAKGGWSCARTEREVRRLRAEGRDDGTADPATGSAPPATEDGGNGVSGSKLLTAKTGRAGVYPIIATDEGLAVDFGFEQYLDLTAAEAKRFAAGKYAWVSATGRLERAAAEAKSGVRTLGVGVKVDRFTYQAKILKVIDADTLLVKVQLGRGRWLKDKLRLRGVNCPELITAAGRRAKRVVEALLAQAVDVTITTTKPDKWDRYLSDVLLTMPSGEVVFLNNRLLENGHAARKERWEFGDWG